MKKGTLKHTGSYLLFQIKCQSQGLLKIFFFFPEKAARYLRLGGTLQCCDNGQLNPVSVCLSDCEAYWQESGF